MVFWPVMIAGRTEASRCEMRKVNIREAMMKARIVCFTYVAVSFAVILLLGFRG